MQITTLKIMVLAAVLVLVLAAAPAVSAADATAAACTKSYLIQLGLSKSGVDEKAVQIVYGYSPLPEGAPGDMKGRITGADGLTLSEFNLRDPRNQFGDVIKVSEDGRNTSVMTGIQTTEDHADLVVMFPVTPEAKTFSLYDSKGTLLNSVDLLKAVNRADWNCTADYGITRNTQLSAKTETTKAPVSSAVAIIAITAGAGGYVITKKTHRKK
jgi:hypothetical protein